MNDKTQKIDVARHTHSELKKLYEEASGISELELSRKLKILEVQVKLVSAWFSSGSSS